MRKFLILILAFLMIPVMTLAETDLGALSVDELTQLRLDVDHELARRIMEDMNAQTINVDGLVFTMERAIIGTGHDDEPALAIVFRVSNTSDSSKSMTNDISYNILQNGENLETTYFHSDDYNGISAVDTMFANIKPGAVDMQLCIAGLLNGNGDRIEVDLFRKHAPRGEDPYCGTFVIDLSELK